MESETPARAIREAVVTWRWSRDPGVRVRGACKARSSVACREKKNWLLFYPWLSEAFPARDVGPRTYVGVRLCRLVICSPKPPAGGDERRADGSTR
jgi:hypothetical protein